MDKWKTIITFTRIRLIPFCRNTFSSLNTFGIHCVCHFGLVDPESIQIHSVDRFFIIFPIFAAHLELPGWHVSQRHAVIPDHRAANLKLFAVWIYNEIPPTPDRLEEICSAAARHGWLARIEGTPLTVQLQYFRAQDLENLTVPALTGKSSPVWVV